MKISVNNPCLVCQSTSSQDLFKITYPEHRYPGDFVVRRCDGCGLLFNSPRLDDADLAKLYNNNYYFFDRNDEEEFQRIIPMYARTVALVDKDVSSKKLLEIGSAKGYLLAVLTKLGWKASGIEISKSAAAFCQDKFGIQPFVGQLEDYVKKGADQFPLVLAIDVLEHVPYPDRFLADCAKCLEPEGRLIIDTPNGGAFNIQIQKSRWIGFNPFHIYLFSEKNLCLLLERSGFTIEKSFSYSNDRQPAVSWLSLFKSFIKLILIKSGAMSLLRGFKQSHFNPQQLQKSLYNTLGQIQEGKDYFYSSDSQRELAQEKTGDNIVIIARKISI